MEWNHIIGIQSTCECSWKKKKTFAIRPSCIPPICKSARKQWDVVVSVCVMWRHQTTDGVTNNLAVLFPGTGSSSAEPAEHLYHYYVLLVQITSTQIHDAPTGRAKGADPAVHKNRQQMMQSRAGLSNIPGASCHNCHLQSLKKRCPRKYNLPNSFTCTILCIAIAVQQTFHCSHTRLEACPDHSAGENSTGDDGNVSIFGLRWYHCVTDDGFYRSFDQTFNHWRMCYKWLFLYFSQ